MFNYSIIIRVEKSHTVKKRFASDIVILCNNKLFYYLGMDNIEMERFI